MRWQGCGCLRCVAGWVTTATAMVAERAGLCSLGVYDERGLEVHGRVAITESTVWRDGAGTGEASPDKELRWHGVPWGVSEVSVARGGSWGNGWANREGRIAASWSTDMVSTRPPARLCATLCLCVAHPR